MFRNLSLNQINKLLRVGELRSISNLVFVSIIGVRFSIVKLDKKRKIATVKFLSFNSIGMWDSVLYFFKPYPIVYLGDNITKWVRVSIFGISDTINNRYFVVWAVHYRYDKICIFAVFSDVGSMINWNWKAGTVDSLSSVTNLGTFFENLLSYCFRILTFYWVNIQSVNVDW